MSGDMADKSSCNNTLATKLDCEAPRARANREALAELMAALRAEEHAIRGGGGPKAAEAQHAKGRLTVRERLKLFLQVLSAVHHANAHLVIHRDLKPSNILVTADGQVKLLDFGVAKLILDGETDETDLTQRGGHPLTPRYASPEQMMSEPISIASDVYSLKIGRAHV